MTKTSRLLFTAATILTLLAACSRAPGPAGVAPAEDVSPETQGLDELERAARSRQLTGDLDAMLERGYIRVLVPYNRSFFFYEGARPRGLVYEYMEAFAKELRKQHALKPAGLTMVYLPTARDRMISGIADGLGDIAMAGLTQTEERQDVVDFVTQRARPVAELIVTGPAAPPLDALEDLSGQRVLVRPSSSYHASVQALNTRLQNAGREGVEVVAADEHLETEDILELVGSGVEQITVADDYLARFWADVIPGIQVHENLVLRERGVVGPAVRKNSPQLLAALNRFQRTHGAGTLFGNVLTNRYLRDNPWVRNPGDSADRVRFEQVLPVFRKYAAKYGFDALLLVAQGYQESRLNQSTRSRSGAVGVMQIKPAIATAEPIGISGVREDADANIHAGVKYLRHLADDYFGDPGITPLNRHLFAIAAYNAGPTRVQSLRQKAAAQGLDPDIWFNNVELVSARTVGRENVNYVRNILKYWVAYRLVSELRQPDAVAEATATRTVEGRRK